MLSPLLALTAARARSVLDCLSAYGAAIIAALAQHGADAPPIRGFKAHPNPAVQLVRVVRALRWADALAAFLSGSFALPPVRTPPAQPGAAAAADREHGEWNEREAGDPAENPFASDRAMIRAFQTRPMGTIVARICRDLGIAKTSELYPADLVAITQTPVEWAAQNPLSPTPSAQPATSITQATGATQLSPNTDHPPPLIRPPPKR